MKNKSLNEIKNLRAFEKHDVLIYAVLALFVAVLFVFFVFAPQKTNSNGFSVTKNNHHVLSFNYDDHSLVIDSAFLELVEKTEQGNRLIVTIYHDEQKKNFNTLEIDKTNRTVDVVEANCSNSKECVHMAKISGSGVIFCAPHALSISCGYIPPVLG